jgi:hypothetical protein
MAPSRSGCRIYWRPRPAVTTPIPSQWLMIRLTV